MRFRAVALGDDHATSEEADGGWTWSGGFSDAAASPESRARFVASAVDWEYPGLPGDGNPHGPQDKTNSTRLMSELRAALDADAKARGHQALLTTAAGTTPSRGTTPTCTPHPADDKRGSADRAVRDFLPPGCRRASWCWACPSTAGPG